MFPRNFDFYGWANPGVYFSADDGANSGGGGTEAKTYTEAEVAAIRAEGEGFKTKFTDLDGKYKTVETELNGLKAAGLTEQQRSEQRAKDAEIARDETAKTAQTREAELKQERLERTVEREARKLNIVDEDAALRLLDSSKIAFDDAGKPTNVNALLEQLVKDKPYLVAPAGGGSPGNPPRGGGAAKTATEIIDAEWSKRGGSSSGFRV